MNLKNKYLMWYVKKYTYLFYKQLVYKQLALEEQIAQQLSGLNLFSLSNNKKYRVKVEFFLCNKRNIAVKWTIHKNSAFPKALLGAF